MSPQPRVLRVAIGQAGGMTEDLAGNLAVLTELVARAAAPDEHGRRPDLVVLPELCTTPYFCTSHAVDRTGWAQPVPGPTTDLVGGLAREHGCAIAFGLYERTAHDPPQPDVFHRDVFHNAVVVVDSSGHLVDWRDPDGGTRPAYRKLSIPANTLAGLRGLPGGVESVDLDEKHFFAPGPGPVVLDLLGTRIACVICYDRSFSEYWAVARALGAEVVLAVVSSLGSREELFLAELATRAMETQTWVVAANRAGPETLNGATVSFFGRSAVITPTGEVVAQAPAHERGAVLRAEIDLDLVAATRAAFPLGRDRRPEVIELLARLLVGDVDAPPRDREPAGQPA